MGLAALLASTVCGLERSALFEALENAVRAYRELRSTSVQANGGAERLVLDFLAEVRAGCQG